MVFTCQYCSYQTGKPCHLQKHMNFRHQHNLDQDREHFKLPPIENILQRHMEVESDASSDGQQQNGGPRLPRFAFS